MVNIRIMSNYRSLEREGDRLEDLPNVKGSAFLDTVLKAGFKMTQAAVHIQTGSLKSSGKMESGSFHGQWEGVISYGGISGGVNNPVTYAIYEKRREEGHDFMEPLKALDALWVEAILRTLKK